MFLPVPINLPQAASQLSIPEGFSSEAEARANGWTKNIVNGQIYWSPPESIVINEVYRPKKAGLPWVWIIAGATVIGAYFYLGKGKRRRR